VKILHVTLDLPYPPMRGAQIRDHALISRMSKRHEISVVSFCESDVRDGDLQQMQRICQNVVAVPRQKEAVFQQLTRTLRQLTQGLPLATTNYVFGNVEAAIRARLAVGDIDILQIEHSFLAPYVRAVAMSPKTRSILSLHNVGALQYPRMARIETGLRNRVVGHLKAMLMQRWEAKWATRFDHVVTVSQSDKDALQAMGAVVPISVVPNGIKTASAALPRADGKNILFVGNLRYPPNQDAARFLVADILPILRGQDAGITLTIAGFDPPADMIAGLDDTGVQVIANAPDLVPLYAQAAVVVAPLRAGGGTRIKILEALALGRPVVSTAVGAEGLDLVQGETALFAETAEAFAGATLRLLTDPALQQAIAANGRRLVSQRYDWDVVAAQLAEVYAEVSRPKGE
jgi:glycosyltransferase involved in cell wall biosynthesis